VEQLVSDFDEMIDQHQTTPTTSSSSSSSGPSIELSTPSPTTDVRTEL